MGTGRIVLVFVLLSVAVGDGFMLQPSVCRAEKLRAACSAALYIRTKPSNTCCREIREKKDCLCLYLSLHSPFSIPAVDNVRVVCKIKDPICLQQLGSQIIYCSTYTTTNNMILLRSKTVLTQVFDFCSNFRYLCTRSSKLHPSLFLVIVR